MMHRYASLGDTVYFHFAANDTGGSADDGESPLYNVRLAGAAADAAPVLSGSGTLLSAAGYPAGIHEVAIAATDGNGFAAGSTYVVIATLTVDGETPGGIIGSFTLKAASSTIAPTAQEVQSGLALEATLTAMKGDGWTDETLVAIRDALAAVGAVTITSGGTNIVGGELVVQVPRGDSYSLVATVTDSDEAAIDLSGYDEFRFTVKAKAYRDDDDDTNKLFQVSGSLSGAGNNVLTFAISVADTELGDRDTWYDCDIECRNTAGTSVRTPLRGRYMSTYDVTRGS